MAAAVAQLGGVDFLSRLADAEKRDTDSRSNSRATTPTPSQKRAAPPAKAAPAKAADTPAKAAVTAAGTPAKPAVKRSLDHPATKAIGRNVGKEITQLGFKPLGPIAAGAFSTIHRAKHLESGVEVAVKTFLQPPADDVEKAEERDRELTVLRLVSEAMHAHVANLIAEYDSPQGGSTHACLQYCAGGSLHAHLGKLKKKQMAMNETNAVVCAAQVASALKHIHSLGVAHRDIKPGNVLYDGHRWRLCDFGFAFVCGDDDAKQKKVMGTLDYLAPEVLSGEGYHGKAVDMWAFGCMLYEMRVGRVAFVAPDIESLKLRIRNGFKGGSETNPWLPHIKPPCRKLITALLNKEGGKRITAEQVLKSKWVSEVVAPTDDAVGDSGRATGAGTAAVSTGLPPSGAADGSSVPRSWWCDVAGKGCLRPVEGLYSASHRCWAAGEYMVCESCYKSAKVRNKSALVLHEGFGVDATSDIERPLAGSITGGIAEEEPVEVSEALEASASGGDADGSSAEGEGVAGSEGAAAPPPPAVMGIVGAGDADAADIDELAKELVALKEKHSAGSRLEACLRELDEQRKATASVERELEGVKTQLAEATKRAEDAEATAKA